MKSKSKKTSIETSSLTIQQPKTIDNQQQSHQILRVAIIGGGVAGLSCASHLKTLSNKSPSIQFHPIVFDTGRLRAGGRCSSRYPKDNTRRNPRDKNAVQKPITLKQSIVDHAAQILSVPTTCPSGNSLEWKAFQDQLIQWEAQGIIQKFPPYSVGKIQIQQSSSKPWTKNQTPTSTTSSSSSSTTSFHTQWLNGNSDKEIGSTMDYYYASQGMASIPQAIIDSSRIHIEQDVWISPSNGLEFIGSPTEENHPNKTTSTPKWSVQSSAKSYGVFDRVIIAHNGKCAFRITSNTPASRLHQLLDTNFYYSVPFHGGNKMTLNSIYSLTFAIKVSENQSTSVLSQAMGKDSFICAFIQNEPNLKFITCQSRKFPISSSTSSPYEIWTVLSSPQVGKQYKAPQENIPMDIQSTVTHLLLSSLERCFNLQSGILTNKDKASCSSSVLVVDSFLQLWGAAVPINTWRNEELLESTIDTVMPNHILSPWETNGFFYDAKFGIGACGDWLLDPSIAGAWESGRRLALWMSKVDLSETTSHDEMRKLMSIGFMGKFEASKRTQDATIGNL